MVCVASERFLSKRFKYVYVQLYSDSHFVWYRSQSSAKPYGIAFLAVRRLSIILLLHCALAAPQCIVISPVCLSVGG